MESEGLLAMVADSALHSQQQQCSLRGEHQQTGNNNEKGNAEESVVETNKAGGVTNEEESEERVKNHSWKGFSLKRQLSKVDLKIKSTFTPALVTSQDGVLVCFLISLQIERLNYFSKKLNSLVRICSINI